MAEKLLIVDDEPEMLSALLRIFRNKGYTVHSAYSGKDAWLSFEKTMYDLIICDMAMDDMNGLELLREVRSSDSTVPFIIMTGVGTIETAVEAIKFGAFHYLTKPFKSHDIEIIAQRALEYGKLNRQIQKFKFPYENDRFRTLLASNNKSMQNILKHVNKISDSSASVLIDGETGTGKSLLASHIHKNSSRRDRPFLTIDCAALTETLLESELFGHVKGSFTGAVNAKRGLLEEGHGGTVFLDEIGEISMATQVKLLSAVQEGLIKPVGSNQAITIDVRFISATSKNIQKEIINGNFREELYYRLAVIPLTLPPLRDRPEDIPVLIDHFLNLFCKKYKKKIVRINRDVLESFMMSKWKGNIRELSNIIERGVLLSENNRITLDCLLQTNFFREQPDKNNMEQKMPLKKIVEISERNAILDALKRTNNHRSRAAKELGISRRALYDKIALYDINNY